MHSAVVDISMYTCDVIELSLVAMVLLLLLLAVVLFVWTLLNASDT
jgi:hypothetical protein